VVLGAVSGSELVTLLISIIPRVFCMLSVKMHHVFYHCYTHRLFSLAIAAAHKSKLGAAERFPVLLLIWSD
jgi:hypothetical protein